MRHMVALTDCLKPVGRGRPVVAASGPKHCQSASLFVSARYSFQLIAIAMTGKTVAQWFGMLASRRRRAATTACAST